MLELTRTAAIATLAAVMTWPSATLALDTFDLGGAAKGDPSVVWYEYEGIDHVAIFVRGPGELMYANVGDEDGTSWTGWAPIGSEALKGSPACVATFETQIDCVAVGAGNSVRHITYDADDHDWSAWHDIGGFATSDPSAVRTFEGGETYLRIFVAGPGNHLFINTDDGDGWSGWEDLDVIFGGDPACTDIFVLGAHCYDTSAGKAEQYSDLTRESGAGIFVDDLGGAVLGKAAPVATGVAGNTLRVFVHGPGSRLWFKKWNNAWADWVQLPVTVNAGVACAIRKSGGNAWCAGVEADGTVKAILIDSGEI